MMVHLGSTIAQLAKMRTTLPGGMTNAGAGRLRNLDAFGTNPGALKARYYIPAGMADNAPLVVVLHGCTQTAEGYDHGSGWSTLADEHGFALLFPEQQRSNNPNLCFNWFSPADARRDSGEPLSIRQMIGTMIAAHGLDEGRVFVTGLSAGGAMASIMLATYPDIFAGGAIIAGLPFGCASSVGDALARMRGDGYPSDPLLPALVRQASDHDGPWPTVSIWHGGADQTVAPFNKDRIIAQWLGIHDVVDNAPERTFLNGVYHDVWRDPNGRPVIEAYDIAGMGHGTPLDTGGVDGCGVAGPYMLDIGLSSTRRLADLWSLTDGALARKAPPTTPPPSPGVDRPSPAPVGGRPTIGAVIDDALRKAGLLR